jgi:hypothetical protein
VFADGTDTSDVYLSPVSGDFFPVLMGYGTPMNSAWFQQDGARPHTNHVLLHLDDVSEETVLSNRYPTQFEEEFFMAINSGLKPLRLFLWGT